MPKQTYRELLKDCTKENLSYSEWYLKVFKLCQYLNYSLKKDDKNHGSYKPSH
jgi:hypothetical protein